MYKFKDNYIYYISEALNKTYVLDLESNDIMEIDGIGTSLIIELLETCSVSRASEILELFSGVDYFEERII